MLLDSDDDDDFEALPMPSSRQNTPLLSEEPFTYLSLLKEKQSAEYGFRGAVGKIKVLLFSL